MNPNYYTFLKCLSFSPFVFWMSLANAECSVEVDQLRYQILHTQLVTDRQTELVWQRCVSGQRIENNSCVGKAEDLSWNDADRYASDLATTSQYNWRLPTLEELETILLPGCKNPALPSVFPIYDTGEVWTSSPGFPVNDVAAILNLQTAELFGIGKGVTRHFLLVAETAPD